MERNADQRLSKLPAGTTGCAPESKPDLFGGGAENAVRISGAGALGCADASAFTAGRSSGTGVAFAICAGRVFGFAGAAAIRTVGFAAGLFCATAVRAGLAGLAAGCA